MNAEVKNQPGISVLSPQRSDATPTLTGQQDQAAQQVSDLLALKTKLLTMMNSEAISPQERSELQGNLDQLSSLSTAVANSPAAMQELTTKLKGKESVREFSEDVAQALLYTEDAQGKRREVCIDRTTPEQAQGQTGRVRFDLPGALLVEPGRNKFVMVDKNDLAADRSLPTVGQFLQPKPPEVSAQLNKLNQGPELGLSRSN